MTKGHNQGKSNDANPKDKTKGQDRHLSDAQKDKSPDKGRNKDDKDPSGGTKGRNAVG